MEVVDGDHFCLQSNDIKWFSTSMITSGSLPPISTLPGASGGVTVFLLIFANASDCIRVYPKTIFYRMYESCQLCEPQVLRMPNVWASVHLPVQYALGHCLVNSRMCETQKRPKSERDQL